jgi:hypothetical protein
VQLVAGRPLAVQLLAEMFRPEVSKHERRFFCRF